MGVFLCFCFFVFFWLVFFFTHDFTSVTTFYQLSIAVGVREDTPSGNQKNSLVLTLFWPMVKFLLIFFKKNKEKEKWKTKFWIFKCACEKKNTFDNFETGFFGGKGVVVAWIMLLLFSLLSLFLVTMFNIRMVITFDFNIEYYL